MNEVEDYEQVLTRQGAAPAPVTMGEIWSANMAASGLDSLSGLGRMKLDAYEDLRAAVQTAYPDQQLGELAARHGRKFGGKLEDNVGTLNTLVAALPEEKRKDFEKLQDIDGRAFDKAIAIEDRQAEMMQGVYGMSGNAWAFLASAVGQMRDPVNLGVAIGTGALGGPFTAVGRQALAAAVTQAPISLEVQRRRRELGLEAGVGRAAGETAIAAGFAGGLSLIGKGVGLGFRFLKPQEATRGVATPSPRVEAPPGAAPEAPPAPAPPAPRAQEQLPLFREPVSPLGTRLGETEVSVVTTDQIAAAELLHARDVAIYDEPAQVKTIAGQELHERKVVEASNALEEKRPVEPTVSSVAEGPAYPRSADHTTAGGRVTVEAGPEATSGPVPFAPAFPASRAQWFDGAKMDLIRSSGERMTVRPMVVELGDLVASHDLEGRPIGAYPGELQPRDRSAPASRTWVVEKAARLEPELLGDSPTAGLGSPVIGPDGVVESGNGRALLLQRAYEAHPDRIQAYQQFLRDKGYDLEGFKQPVLVRMREGDLPMAERGALALEANVSATAGLSVRERAFSDAKYLTDDLLSHHAGGEVQDRKNVPFVKAFANQAVAPEERPNFIDGDNNLSADGARRIEAAMVARAWGDQDVVASLYEATDPTSKSILGGFADSAPTVARLRAAVEEGRIPPESDPSGAFVQAYRLVDEARRGGPKLVDRLQQIDIERGAVPDDVASAVRLYFRNDNLTLAAGRDAIAEKIESAANRALTQANALGDLFDTAPSATATLRAARLTAENVSELDVAGPGAVRDIKGKPQQPPTIDERTIVSDELDKLPNDAAKMEKVHAMTAENQVDVDRYLKELDEQGFGTKSKFNVKADEKILEKASRPSVLKVKPWHGIEHVRDTFRFKSELDDLRALPQIIEYLEKSGLFDIIKRDTAKFFAPKEWGFRIVAFDLRSKKNGQIIEYYLPVREMQQAQDAGGGHLLFEKWRNRDFVELTPAERLAYDVDAAASRKLYDDALAAYVARSGATESELRAALSQVSTSPESGTGLSSAKVSTETGVRSQVPSVERSAMKSSEGSQTTTTGLSGSPKYADLEAAGIERPSTPDIATAEVPGKAVWPKEDAGTAAKGDEILVYRLAERDELAGRNAGNAEGVATLIERLDGDGPRYPGTATSDTIFAYRVKLTEDTGPYVGVVAGKESPTYPNKEVDQGRVGSQAEAGVVSYFFPKAGAGYTHETLGSVPLAKVRAKLEEMGFHGDADLAGNAKTAEAIRAVFEETKPKPAPAAAAAAEPARAPAAPAKPPKPIGDQVLAAEAERALAEIPGGTGDVELKLVGEDGATRSVMARQLLAEVAEDQTAAEELAACIGVTTLEAAE